MNRSLQRTIFAACRELGLDNDARRALQESVTGKSSLTDMNERELKLVVARLKADGFAYTKPRNPRRKAAPRADLRLIHVLWRALADAGALERPGRDGLNAFVRSRFGDAWGSVPADIDMLRDHEQIDAVIQALKEWVRREGIDFDWRRVRR